MLHFIFPFVYATITSTMIIKYEVLTLGMNTFTWCLYFANILATYIAYKIGKEIDKCLEQSF